MEEHNSTGALLPHVFYRLGWILFAGTLVLSATVQWALPEYSSLSIQTGLQSGILLGLFVAAASKEREEDELTGLLRLKAYEWAFRWGIISFLVSIIFKDPAYGSSFYVLVSMLLAYHLVFFIKKKNR